MLPGIPRHFPRERACVSGQGDVFHPSLHLPRPLLPGSRPTASDPAAAYPLTPSVLGDGGAGGEGCARDCPVAAVPSTAYGERSGNLGSCDDGAARLLLRLHDRPGSHHQQQPHRDALPQSRVSAATLCAITVNGHMYHYCLDPCRYTLGKQSVHIVELVATSAIFDLWCWNGVAVWVIACYLLILVTSAAILCIPGCRLNAMSHNGYTTIGDKDSRRRRAVSDSSDSEGDTGVETGEETDSVSSSPLSSQHTGSPGTTRVVSTESVRSVSVAAETKTSTSVWQDMRSVSASAWALILCTEISQFTIGVIGLAAVMHLQSTWDMSPRTASLVIFLPQIVVMPIFFLTTLIRLHTFAVVAVSMFVTAVIGVVPFLPSAVYISVVVFVVELCNAMRLSGQMPCFAALVKVCKATPSRTVFGTYRGINQFYDCRSRV